jgi:hypothetical protein
MNKVYKNVDEFIKLTFPNSYEEKNHSADTSLESYIAKTSEEFKLRIDAIIKSWEKPGAPPDNRSAGK